MRDVFGNTAVKIALIYFTVSGTWIAASDLLLGALVEDAKIIAYLGIVKGWFFVVITTIMLFTLVRGNMRLLEAKNKDLHARSMETEAAYEELAATEEELRWQLDELQRHEAALREKEQELSAQNVYLDALYNINIDLINRRDVHDLLHAILRRAGLLLGTEHGFVFVAAQDEKQLEFSVTSGFYNRFADVKVEPNEGVAGRAWMEKKIIVINDYPNWEGKVVRYPVDELKAVVAVPLMTDKRVVGIFGLAYLDDTKFDEVKIRILERFAVLAAVALDNALLYESACRELAERERREEQIYYLAYHDALTGLPNRNYIHMKLDEILAKYNGSACLAVIMVDIDDFRLVNNIAGHRVGDELLIEVAKSLVGIFEGNCLLASMGGDKFILVVEDAGNIEKCTSYADKILEECRKCWSVAGYEFYITVSIGINVYAESQADSATMLKNADTALAMAKAAGRNTYRFYDDSVSAALLTKLNMSRELRAALENEEFVIYYQPRVEVTSGQVKSLEALIRWKHSEKGMIPPGVFIPLAEETGLIVGIGTWVLKTVCEQIAKWSEIGIKIPVSVNLSARQFYQTDLLAVINDILAQTKADPLLLELEITESMVMNDVEKAAGILAELKKQGIRIAMDDFGTGHSSLINIRSLPIDIIKIDKSFVQEVENCVESASIVETIVVLAHCLSLEVTAEGVETQQQWEFLKRCYCDEAQGYFFARPAPVEEIERMLKG